MRIIVRLRETDKIIELNGVHLWAHFMASS